MNAPRSILDYTRGAVMTDWRCLCIEEAYSLYTSSNTVMASKSLKRMKCGSCRCEEYVRKMDAVGGHIVLGSWRLYKPWSLVVLTYTARCLHQRT